MALYNRVKVAITAGGVGNLTIGNNIEMYRSFAGAGVPDGTVVSYVIEDTAAKAWEYGHGTYTAPSTFVRTTVLANDSGTTAPINAGTTAVLMIDALAEDLLLALTVGNTAIAGGTSGRFVFNNGGKFGEAANLTYDGTNTTAAGLILKGATSGLTTVKAAPTTTSYTMTLPAAVATVAGQSLTSDTAGNLSWTSETAASISFAATDRVLGRDTAGAGAGEELTASQVLDWIGATQGQVLYRSTVGWTALAAGTAGQYLRTAGTGANPAWSDLPVYSVEPFDATKAYAKDHLVAKDGTIYRAIAAVPAAAFDATKWARIAGTFTATRVPVAGADGALTDDAQLTYDATNNNMRIGGVTIGSAAASLTTVTGKVTAAATGLTVEAVGALPVDVTTNGAKRATFNDGVNPFNVLTTTSEDAFVVDYRDNVVCGSGRITNGADRQNDMLYIPTTDVKPTGVPPTYLGRVPIVFCVADKKLYTYVTTATGWEAVL